jgi:hypothetical protein
VFVFALVVASCSGRQRTPAAATRITLEAAVHGLAAIDTVVAQAIRRDAAQPHVPGAMRTRWQGTVEALEHTHSALVLAERAIDTYTATQGSACPAYLAVLLIKDSTNELTTALRATGLAIPEAVGPTLSILTGATQFLAPRCADGGV